MRLVSTTEKSAALRQGLSDNWRNPPSEQEEDSGETGGEMESQPKTYLKGATSRHPDFDRVIKAADRAGHEVPEPAASAICSLGESDRIDMVHYLGTHPREIRKLHDLPEEARTSRVHELLSQLRRRQESSRVASLPLENLPLKEFFRRRDAHEAARRRR